MHCILDFYDHSPDDGRVISLDEFGPPEPGAEQRESLAARHVATPITGHLQPLARRDAHARRAGPGHWEDPLPDPAPQRHRELLGLLKARNQCRTGADPYRDSTGRRPERTATDRAFGVKNSGATIS